MSRLNSARFVFALAVAALVLAPGSLSAQSRTSQEVSVRSGWQQRVLGRTAPADRRPVDPRHVGSASRTFNRQVSPSKTTDPLMVPAAAVLPTETAVSGQQPTETPQAEEIPAGEPVEMMEEHPVLPGPGAEGCAECGGELCALGPEACTPNPCWFAPGCIAPWWWEPVASYWLCGLELFGGVHGFKGPADQGRNGNFGFHEGFNFGAPLGDPWGMGYQIGFQAAHSNFSGDQTTGIVSNSDRDQFFLTAGIFHRKPAGGIQWGVVYDYLHDSYHGTADLSQLRTEVALVWACQRELGFWGAFATGSGRFDTEVDQVRLLWDVEPTDVYALFYRRNFSAGGRGRMWTGFTGEGDAILGADLSVPLGTNWALENSFTYLVPKEGHDGDAQTTETWSVSIQLVWFPGRSAVEAISDPFRPLLSVADNGQFLLYHP